MAYSPLFELIIPYFSTLKFLKLYKKTLKLKKIIFKKIKKKKKKKIKFSKIK